MDHFLIKFKTALKMFASFLVSKMTKFENFEQNEIISRSNLLETFGSYCVSEVKEIMIFQL